MLKDINNNIFANMVKIFIIMSVTLNSNVPSLSKVGSLIQELLGTCLTVYQERVVKRIKTVLMEI